MQTIVGFLFALFALCAESKTFIAEVGKKVTLQCGTPGHKTRLEWYQKNEKILMILGTNGVPSKGTAQIKSRSNLRGTALEISSVKETDAGEFTCEADGKKFSHEVLVISVWADPAPELTEGNKAVLRCEVKGLDQSTSVKWLGPDQSTFNQPTVELEPVAASHGGKWSCSVTKGEASINAGLTLSVKAAAPVTTATPHIVKDQTGDQSQSDGTQRGTDHQPDGAGLQLLGLQLWIWIALGGGCLLIVLLIIFVIIMCKRNKRRKRTFLKSAQQSQLPRTYCQCNHQTAAAKPQQGRRREKPSALPLQSY
ncbi:unnamed protein product [Menidia menidia]|uniref:(Atlantic silverside) hypothetical protein n=1 Tax=Menidia menidia TaxID=238744 RepID=A0A8S4BQY3_9TELE|nr:unnamed protein product [Menidia menidia]